MIAIIDYGAGNIFSVKNALDYLGFECKLTSDKNEIKEADAIILPGVGAFPAAMNMLEKSGLIDTIKEEATKKPLLGICLGMQMLFEKGYEFEECNGLGLIQGFYKIITAFSAIINITIAMIIINLKSENHTPATVVFIGKLFTFNEIRYLIKAVFDIKNAVVIKPVHRKLCIQLRYRSASHYKTLP